MPTDTDTRTVDIPGLLPALKFVLPAMGAKGAGVHTGLRNVWISPSPVWTGFADGWTPQWDSTVSGVTLMATDRYRLHIVGLVTPEPLQILWPACLDGADLTNAIKAAPRGTADGTLTLHGDPVTRAVITWANGAAVPVGAFDGKMPDLAALLQGFADDTDDTGFGYSARYLTDALKALGDCTVRFRPSRGRKPAALAPTDLQDSRAAIVMPVRLPT